MYENKALMGNSVHIKGNFESMLIIGTYQINVDEIKRKQLKKFDSFCFDLFFAISNSFRQFFFQHFFITMNNTGTEKQHRFFYFFFCQWLRIRNVIVTAGQVDVFNCFMQILFSIFLVRNFVVHNAFFVFRIKQNLL